MDLIDGYIGKNIKIVILIGSKEYYYQGELLKTDEIMFTLLDRFRGELILKKDHIQRIEVLS